MRKSKSGIVIAFVYLFLLGLGALGPGGEAQTRRTSRARSRITAENRKWIPQGFKLTQPRMSLAEMHRKYPGLKAKDAETCAGGWQHAWATSEDKKCWVYKSFCPGRPIDDRYVCGGDCSAFATLLAGRCVWTVPDAPRKE